MAFIHTPFSHQKKFVNVHLSVDNGSVGSQFWTTTERAKDNASASQVLPLGRNESYTIIGERRKGGTYHGLHGSADFP